MLDILARRMLKSLDCASYLWEERRELDIVGQVSLRSSSSGLSLERFDSADFDSLVLESSMRFTSETSSSSLSCSLSFLTHQRLHSVSCLPGPFTNYKPRHH
jgi:hypothetical protein